MGKLQELKTYLNKYGATKKPGYVYLAKGKDNPKGCKIGLSKNVEKRMKQLKAKELHSFPTDDMALAEIILHEKYGGKRDWSRGEWFDLTEDDIAEISGITSLDFGEDGDRK